MSISELTHNQINFIFANNSTHFLITGKMDKTEKEFIERINAKQIEAYRELFRMFYRYLVLYAIRFVQQQEVAEDIVQEVFISLWKGRKEYNSFHGFRSFLYESVKNGCLNHIKHRKQEERYFNYTLRTDQEETDDSENYELMREEIYRKLYQAVLELPEGCRKVFEQHLAGKKNEEIAQLFHVSIETVKTQKKRAVHMLREKLGNFYIVVTLLKLI